MGIRKWITYICRPCLANDEVNGRLNDYNLRTLFETDLTKKALKELRCLVPNIFDQLPRDPLIIAEIETITKDQTNTKWWNLMRGGRITAFVLKEVCRTLKTKPAISLITRICYPERINFSTPSVRYGVKPEKTAIEKLFQAVIGVHRGLINTKSCFIISRDEPHLGASPDALFRCECHGIISVEVKCPYSARDNPDVVNV